MIIFFFIFSDRLFTFLKSRQAKNAICDIFSLEWGFSYGRGHVKKGSSYARRLSNERHKWQCPTKVQTGHLVSNICDINISSSSASIYQHCMCQHGKHSSLNIQRHLCTNILFLINWIYWCTLHRFTKTFFWNFQKCRAVLCYILIDKQMLH